MELTRKDRWIIANQLLILEKLESDNDSKQDWARQREAIERGYAFYYRDYYQHIFEEPDTMSDEECDETILILAMFDAIRRHVQAHGLPAGIEEWGTQFQGFDCNSRKEARYARFADYFCADRKYEDLHKPADFNSHSPMLAVYRRQLDAWNASKEREMLTADDVKRIAAARVHPQSK